MLTVKLKSQGVKAAEMFPSDFDGIVAGSPALDFNNLQSWRARFFPITGSASTSDFILPATWTNLIHGEVLNQCDGLDGAVDGIIEDPNLCSFRPEALLCKEKTTTDCLTSIQVEKVREIFSPFYRENGSLIYPAMQPGSEVLAAMNLYAGKPFSYSEVTPLPEVCRVVADMCALPELVQICRPRSIMGRVHLQRQRRRRSRSAQPFKHPNLARQPFRLPKRRRQDTGVSWRSRQPDHELQHRALLQPLLTLLTRNVERTR